MRAKPKARFHRSCAHDPLQGRGATPSSADGTPANVGETARRRTSQVQDADEYTVLTGKKKNTVTVKHLRCHLRTALASVPSIHTLSAFPVASVKDGLA